MLVAATVNKIWLKIIGIWEEYLNLYDYAQTLVLEDLKSFKWMQIIFIIKITYSIKL